MCCAQAVLSNGLRVFLVEDHDVPLVKTTLLFRGGLRTSPPDKAPFHHRNCCSCTVACLQRCRTLALTALCPCHSTVFCVHSLRKTSPCKCLCAGKK